MKNKKNKLTYKKSNKRNSPFLENTSKSNSINRIVLNNKNHLDNSKNTEKENLIEKFMELYEIIFDENPIKNSKKLKGK
ncbi:hypothetical protein [Fervidicoccus sp.]|uniref:hypothetical protein n=1 Tax=Fervidicoccus sp. TaxID=2060324 RepID=UPI003D09D51D